jgi:6-phosphogluconate dehydrogenase
MAKKAKSASGGGRQQFGLVGLAVMGENLILNVESKGFTCAVWNRTTSKVDDFLNARGKGKKIVGCHSPAELAAALERPRKVMLMVKAGQPVDDMIAQLLPVLSPGDLIIDGGNSFFKDTERRSVELEKKGYLFIGTGVSGGEEGALKGPAIMPGGQPAAYKLVEPIFNKISAQVGGEPCSTYIGPRGAGHYVKMVHNGIEYGIMQCMAETHDLMKSILGLDAPAQSKVFRKWNAGKAGGYLMELAVACLARIDPDTGKPLVDVILDKAGQKGTGKWASQNALDLGIPVPTIDMAVEGRILSALKSERVAASKVLHGPAGRRRVRKDEFLKALGDALYLGTVCCYAQGMALLREASKEYQYNYPFDQIARIWKGGCIIRSKLLVPITEAFRRSAQLPNLLVDPYFARTVRTCADALRTVVAEAARAGVPVLGLSSALGYLDSYRRERLPQDLTQAQRDYFGAHTYERVDKPGIFHTPWTPGA